MTCPACNFLYKLRDGGIPHHRVRIRWLAPRGPVGNAHWFWEFTCQNCGIVRRIPEKALVDQYNGEEPDLDFPAWVEELGA